nr:hypothetical protein CFP56_36205 [Quercus suber]
MKCHDWRFVPVIRSLIKTWLGVSVHFGALSDISRSLAETFHSCRGRSPTYSEPQRQVYSTSNCLFSVVESAKHDASRAGVATVSRQELEKGRSGVPRDESRVTTTGWAHVLRGLRNAPGFVTPPNTLSPPISPPPLLASLHSLLFQLPTPPIDLPGGSYSHHRTFFNMFGRSITTITACALGASAFLLPPGIAPSTNSKDVSFPSIANPKHQTLTFPCPSCAFSSAHEKSARVDGLADDHFRIQGGSNSIAVTFTISEDGRNLEMGGSGIYPAAHALPKVHQISASTSIADFESGDAPAASLEVTSFHAAFFPRKVNFEAAENGGSITVLRISDMSLEGQSLPLPELAVTMLEAADGQILILNVESTHGRLATPSHDDAHKVRPFGHHEPGPFFRPGGFGHHGKPMHKECSAVLPAPLCRLSHAIEAKIHGMHKGGRPGCHGRKGKHSNPWMDKDGHVALPSHIKGPKFHMGSQLDESNSGRPEFSFQSHLHKGSHQRHHHGHGFFHAFVKGFIAVLIPVMAGVTVGMAVSFVGLAKGKHSNPWMDKDGHVALPSHIKGPKFHMGSQLDESNSGRPEFSFQSHLHKGSHQRHHHGHGFFHAFVKGFIAVLIPVMAGVTVGMAVSFVGLAFGRLITFLWIKFVRGGRRGYASVALTDDIAESGDVKSADFVGTDAPPMYEDAPKYEDVAQVDVKEEK